MPRRIKILRHPIDREQAKIFWELLRDAVAREEHRLGRRMTPQETRALALRDFEPILDWPSRALH